MESTKRSPKGQGEGSAGLQDLEDRVCPGDTAPQPIQLPGNGESVHHRIIGGSPNLKAMPLNSKML